MRKILLAAALLIPAPSHAQEAPDPARLRADVETLVGFGTRHTLSDTQSDTRGIGAARRWAMGELSRIGDACDCIDVANIARGFEGPRAPNGVQVVDILGFQPGEESHRVVIIAAHIDSRARDVMDFTSDAPGANDDGSGVALVIEAARILSREKFRATIVYALLSGEEQGLWGGELLAETAEQNGWTVSAMLNNDIVGNIVGQDGRQVADRVRVFSEGIRAGEDIDAQMARRAAGGEDDGPSRALAKALDGIADTLPQGLDVFLVRRPDRFGRGGDHLAFLARGYPAVRITSGVELYDAQHQDVRSEGGRAYGDTVDRMDFDYLAKVTAINVAMARRLARAPAAPEGVTIGGALATDTRVRWEPVEGAAGYRVHWRRADARAWTDSIDVTATEMVLEGVVVDDHFVGVSALGADGAESLVSFGMRGR
ncbi:M20/M25/M40 family metallo-hydrolase [Stakelama tenebrarum]|uniref:M20/M25/M40 family metallo-hydrolase n=1 Tax=Stakelama tenebrarum TaxID=2711215 RepID=A0A6G6Y998_9SPHN|nr:M20/M25/M40 family metallo-hydrolase [Sphingosinithalassobacter tenebrarum]QIG81288.1 M20/M25/M40 family metallo-hydrolase [Sphingosinithalassobacter tenebrarum]